uniref:phenylalanine--tRNA ligase n=1 Tax=Ixodes ricinus TaxID=34613 RepID=A0A0K8RA80_IXORI
MAGLLHLLCTKHQNGGAQNLVEGWVADTASLATLIVLLGAPQRVAFPLLTQVLSSHPPCLADMSFWVPTDFAPNDFFDLVRSVGGDLVERVEPVDVFTHPKTQRTSHCFRVVYRHMERVMTQEEANIIHREVGKRAEERLGVELRIK